VKGRDLCCHAIGNVSARRVNKRRQRKEQEGIEEGALNEDLCY